MFSSVKTTLNHPVNLSPGAARANSSSWAKVKRIWFCDEMAALTSIVSYGKGGFTCSRRMMRRAKFLSQFASGMMGSTSMKVLDVSEIDTRRSMRTPGFEIKRIV